MVAAFVKRTHGFLAHEREKIYRRLEKLSWIQLFPTPTTYILARLAPPVCAEALCEHLLSKHIVIRNCANFNGLSNEYIRMSLKSGIHNTKLAEVLNEIDPQALSYP